MYNTQERTERKREPGENNTKSGKVQCVPSLDLAQNQVRDGVARFKEHTTENFGCSDSSYSENRLQ